MNAAAASSPSNGWGRAAAGPTVINSAVTLASDGTAEALGGNATEVATTPGVYQYSQPRPARNRSQAREGSTP